MSIMMAVSGWQLQSPSILGSGTISISFSGAAMKRDLMRSRLNGQKLADPLCAQFSLSLTLEDCKAMREVDYLAFVFMPGHLELDVRSNALPQA